MKTVIHVTHEAVQKIGGIGAVLHGLVTAKAYRAAVKRDIFLGPLFFTAGPPESRLPGGTVLYSGIDHIRNTPFAEQFDRIEYDYGVKLVYGTKKFHDPLTGVTTYPEVLLVDVHHYHADKIGTLKFILFKDYGIESEPYHHVWDYEQYCRIADPGLEALRVIGACEKADPGSPPIIFAHEYMGMPTVLSARSRYPGQFRSIFYAHEVATMRRIVEHHEGHDTMFYNVLEKAAAQNKYVDEVFGSQNDFYKHPLVGSSRFCDNIFAVGDYVVKELRFLRQEFANVHIDLAYNGVPSRTLTLEEKLHSRAKLQTYCQNLLGYRPDFLLTHVTRLVPSKGLWRDIAVVEQLEKHLAKKNESAVVFILSTETSVRPRPDILSMEKKYQWPIAHREGWPDLSGGEATFYVGVQAWNARARHCKIVYINQFGFNPSACGNRIPADMDFLDIRKGSDAEFGQSIYEPFGIAQVEPISFGGICIYTSLCGCAGFVDKAAGGKKLPNFMSVDYTQLPPAIQKQSIEMLLKMSRTTREEIEVTTAAQIAAELYTRLPRTHKDFATLIETGGKLGENMSWDAVAKNYVIPGMDHALAGKGGAS